MRKTLFLLLALSQAIDLCAQDTFSSIIQHSIPTGKYEISFYDSNMVRVQFTPYGYMRTEHLGNAVSLTRSDSTGIRVAFRNDSIVLTRHNSEVIVFPKRSKEYRGLGSLLQEGEMIFGTGSRALPQDRRGQYLRLHNTAHYGYDAGVADLNYSVPFLTSSRGYGLFYDNPSSGFLDIGKKDPVVLEFGASSGQLNVFVIFGDYRQVLQSYHRLTGTQPIPPRWAFGNLMSRFGYTGEAQMKQILDSMKKQAVPVDAVLFDLFWFGDSIKGTMGNLDWMNRKAWSFPEKMIRQLKRQGIQSILVTEPYFVSTSRNFRDARRYFAVDSSRKPYIIEDFYFGKAGLIDIFRKDARRWFSRFYRKQMNNGVEGWWSDLGEPEKHPRGLYHQVADAGSRRLFAAEEVHNLYGHTWTTMLYELYRSEFPDRRLFNLNRSGFAGSQRFSIFPWTGDVARTWEGFRSQLPLLLGMTMSGLPYAHSDAGGFAGGTQDPELYVRWLQFAVFTPVFRPHGTALYEKEPAALSFPTEAALMKPPFNEYAKWAVHLRYTLLPYNYSLAYEQEISGRPLMAPMYYHYPGDSMALRAADQFMWGEEMLISPVWYKESGTRQTYLPEGRWYRFFDTTSFSGNQWVRDTLRMEDIPVYVKEGSFIPMWTPGRHLISTTMDYDTLNQITIRYFPSEKKTDYRMFDDDGKSRTSIKRGNYELIHFSGITRGDEVTITIEPGHAGLGKRTRTMELQLTKPFRRPLEVTINGKTVDESALVKRSYGYNPGYQYESIRFEYTGEPLRIVIRLMD